MGGKADKEVNKSAVDREKRKRGGDGTDREKGRKERERNRKDRMEESKRELSTPQQSPCF